MKARNSLGQLALSFGVVTSALSVTALGDESTATNVIIFKSFTKNDQGVVRCGVFREKGWLKNPVQASIVKIHGKVARCVFNELPKGVYGISGFHDQNNNGELDTNLVGYPVESYCASRNARSMFSAPSFSDAKFKFGGGTLQLEAHMK